MQFSFRFHNGRLTVNSRFLFASPPQKKKFLQYLLHQFTTFINYLVNEITLLRLQGTYSLSVGAVVQLVEYPTRNQEVAGSTHTRSTESNLEQVANLLCAQANSASYPQRNDKWVVATATGWRPSVADWGDGVSALSLRGSNCLLARAINGHIMRCGTIGSCQSAPTSKIVKRCWSRVWLM